MKHLFKIGLLVLAAVIVVRCSTPVHVEQSQTANFAAYRTYAWVDVRNNQTDNRNVTGLTGETILRVAGEELAKKGLTETTANADVLLSYDVLVERSTQQRSDPVYTQPFSRVYYNPYFRRWGTILYPSRFIGYDSYNVPVREGTLTLTMADAQTDSTVWQGWTTKTMENRRFTSADVEKAVKDILKKFDVPKSQSVAEASASR